MIFLEVLAGLSFTPSSKYQKGALKSLGTRMHSSLKNNSLAWTSDHFIVWLDDKIYNHTTPYYYWIDESIKRARTHQTHIYVNAKNVILEIKNYILR